MEVAGVSGFLSQHHSHFSLPSHEWRGRGWVLRLLPNHAQRRVDLRKNRLGTVLSSLVDANPVREANRSHVPYDNGNGTHGLPESALYSTRIRRPSGLRYDRSISSTGSLRRTKCRAFAITMPSSAGRSSRFVKSACM